MFEIRATPNDGIPETLLAATVRHEPEFVPPNESVLEQELVAELPDGSERRFPIGEYSLVVTTVPEPEPELVGDEQPDELGATPDNVRAAYAEVQDLRDQITAAAGDRTPEQLAEVFAVWAPAGEQLDTATPGMLRNFLAAMQQSRQLTE